MEAEYFFDAKKMIEAFDMDEFLKERDDLDLSNGAFLIITDKQYILSYNKDYGKGLHLESMANALFEIWGEKKEEEEIPYIVPSSEKENIMASLVNEPGMSYMAFPLKYLKRITPNQLALFKKFLDRYNDKFIRCAKENIDSFTIYVEKDTEEEYHDLTPVYDYLKTIVDENKVVREENIIGETLLSSKTK